MSVFRGPLRLPNDLIWKCARLCITESGLSCVGVNTCIVAIDILSMWATSERMQLS